MTSKEYISLLKEKQSEHQEQIEVVNYCKRNNILFTAVPNGGKRHKKTAFDLKKEGVSAGFPDMMIFKRGDILFLEMKQRARTLKSGKKSISHTKLSDNQKVWIQELESRNFNVCVAYGSDEAINAIKEFMKD